MARLCNERPRLTRVKQRERWTKMRRISSGLPRLYWRHHLSSGSTMAITPRLREQTGISRVPFSCSLRPEDLADAVVPLNATAAAATAKMNFFIACLPAAVTRIAQKM